jgi:hypothetical protein
MGAAAICASWRDIPLSLPISSPAYRWKRSSPSPIHKPEAKYFERPAKKLLNVQQNIVCSCGAAPGSTRSSAKTHGENIVGNYLSLYSISSDAARLLDGAR